MDRVTYAGDSIVTGSAIAHALLDYAQALSQVGASGTVRIPTLEDDGRIGHAEILVGPASQLVSIAVATDFEEVSEGGLVEHLTHAAERLRREGAPTGEIVIGTIPMAGGGTDYGI
jgi:hypothetical protein